jgi:hypothetical protein
MRLFVQMVDAGLIDWERFEAHFAEWRRSVDDADASWVMTEANW